MESAMSALPQQAPASPEIGELPAQRDEIVRTTRSCGDLCLVNYRLQSTLELDELLRLFSEEARAQVAVDEVRFERDRMPSGLRVGGLGAPSDAADTARAGFSVDYPLWLADEYLGRIAFRSRRIFDAEEVKRLGALVTALIFPLRNALLFRDAGQGLPQFEDAS